MIGRSLFRLLALAALAAGVSACTSGGGVQPGVVNTQAPSGYRGETGRVVAIREAPIRGSGSGTNDGTLIGGGIGAAGGAAIGAAATNSVGGAVVGGLLGAVGGAIAGTAIDRSSTRRGIEVTVQTDTGGQLKIAQPDDGDVQTGDRVQVIYDRNGVAKAVRDPNPPKG
jgi:outer membrane lipoprotein SlyB